MPSETSPQETKEKRQAVDFSGSSQKGAAQKGNGEQQGGGREASSGGGRKAADKAISLML